MRLYGNVLIRMTCPDPGFVLNLFHRKEIYIKSVKTTDDFTLVFITSGAYLNDVMRISEQYGYEIKYRAMNMIWERLYRRHVLVATMLLLFVLSIYLPTKVLFIQVQGNNHVSDKYILEKASEIGICFGVKRENIRSEKMKNALLEQIPQLQWAGINTTGCVATITVREKNEPNSYEPGATGVTSIIASRDGVIQHITVSSGKALCVPGQAVKAGQMLVSGYTDCGLSIRAEIANAKIYALTDRRVALISPANRQSRGEILKEERKYSLQIGKKLINFFNNSRISHTTCAKIYERHKLVLPGGFQLPVSFITQTCKHYSSVETVSVDNATDWICEYARKYIMEHMVDGRILSEKFSERATQDVYCFEGDYTCYESIGQVKQEEIIDSWEKQLTGS